MVRPQGVRKSGGRERRLAIEGVPLIIALALTCALTACVTSKKYRLAKADTPAAQPMNLKVAVAPIELTLATLIVFKGPGSWKREARWDEYVVVVLNSGEQPVVVDSAELIDLQGQVRTPGDDPWKLEKLSRSNWDKYGKTGLHVVEGVGAAALYAGAVASVTYGSIMGVGASSAGGVAALSVIPIIGLVDVSAVVVMNHKNKASVLHEFQRRRLALPHSVAPGESVTGSFFFPMTPGPQRLILRGHNGELPLVVVLELGPLSGLHLQPAK